MAIVSAVATGTGRTVTLPNGSLVSVGPRAERGYFSVMPFDQVDMANGDLRLSFTDLVLNGDAGMDLRFSRSFSLQGTALPDRWAFSFVDVPILMKNPVNPSPSSWSPTLVMGDGSTRPLYSGIVSGYLVTTEFWRYHVSSRTLYLPNGWVATYESSGNPTGGIMLVEVHDPFGNQITPTWDTTTARPWKPTSVSQTVSGTTRTVTFQYLGQNPRLPSTMTFGSRTAYFHRLRQLICTL
jgi:hypothetical protein